MEELYPAMKKSNWEQRIEKLEQTFTAVAGDIIVTLGGGKETLKYYPSKKKRGRLVELCLAMVILLALSLLALGCAEAQKVTSLNELLQPRTTDTLFAQKWVNVYGDKSKSIEHYNIALMLRIMNQQDARIKVLEGQVVSQKAEIEQLWDLDGTTMNISDFTIASKPDPNGASQ